MHSDFQSDRGAFQQLFASSPDPTWIIDNNRFVDCNAVAVRTLGYASRDALLNLHPSKLSPPIQPDGSESYAKSAGKGVYHLFDAAMMAAATNRSELERALREAVTKQEFVLHYQPLIHASTQRPIGVEA